ncbi:MAG: endolytic transglycosylase MltG [Muribaculaceae bacterium]|nr:endolytic transglycosylase MltG [Muribaculaceae bacterium]
MNKNLKRWLLALTIIVAVMGICTLVLLNRTFEAELAARVNIPKDSSKESVRDSLESALGAESGSLVYKLWSVAGGDVARAHGSYLVEPGTKLVEVAKNIAGGRQTPVSVTINNVRTLDQLTKLLSSKLEVSQSELKQALQDRLGDRDDFGATATFPAAVLPDTYEFYWTDTADHVVNKLVQTRDKFWNADRLSKASKLGLTPVQVATIASIVEEESNKKEELPIIARLYINRVHQGMKLQADPTVKFALGNFALRRITGKDLRVDSPYNTYKYAGLPPGPIRVPKASTIDAVLNSPPNPYLFMCAKSDFSGYHDFAADAKTHAANAKKYWAALNERKIYR